MAPEVAFEALSGLPRGSTVLDPMCGSGSVLRAANEHGHEALGIDIDPLAVLISRVWTTPLSADYLEAAVERTLAKAAEIEPASVRIPSIDEDAETQEFVSFWYAPPQAAQLRKLVGALPSRRSRTGRALRLLLSRTIVTKDRGASRARDVSHSRPHRVADAGVSFDVLAAFRRAGVQLARHLRDSPPPGKTRVFRGDARRLGRVGDNEVQALVTSPPYLNAIDYLRGHRLSLVWLGFRVRELSQLRSRSVGAERAPGATLPDFVQELERELEGVSSLGSRDRAMFRRFLVDLDSLLREGARVLEAGSPATFVIGNSLRRGVLLDNTSALIGLAGKNGFRLVDRVERKLPAAHRYLPPPQSSDLRLGRRMRTEAVLTFEFAG